MAGESDGMGWRDDSRTMYSILKNFEYHDIIRMWLRGRRIFNEDDDMRIERVDEKTVKCFLSNEELEEYEIDYKDFVLRSDKAREVVQEIIEQAAEEVGYKPPKFAFDLQIMMLPDQGLILTFSDRDPELKETDQFIECLREMKRILQRTRERIGEGSGESLDNGVDVISGGQGQNTHEYGSGI